MTGAPTSVTSPATPLPILCLRRAFLRRGLEIPRPAMTAAALSTRQPNPLAVHHCCPIARTPTSFTSPTTSSTSLEAQPSSSLLGIRVPWPPEPSARHGRSPVEHHCPSHSRCNKPRK
uniref:Uncharacterized protein n=1 Tax=Setaria viridis TaxID=4556 RepID=A0A4U6UZF9_SETVI|nr:hypothetical protein SEVIR_4G039800v2 [Setaria viridis]